GSPTIIGNPSTNTFLAGSNTQIVVTRNFAGAIFIGKSFDPANSKIEISFSPPQNYRPGVDVSYVDGYSVPITCSCGGVPVTGCNIPLFLQGRTCPRPGPGDKVICYNPKKVVDNGPADPFFQPCQGAAYTYPNDHTANGFGKCDSGDIQCCVGFLCGAASYLRLGDFDGLHLKLYITVSLEDLRSTSMDVIAKSPNRATNAQWGCSLSYDKRKSWAEEVDPQA
ncbi:MAG: hypothetical protein Q9205_001000, partial [Flavoplaca limonia]